LQEPLRNLLLLVLLVGRVGFIRDPASVG
jgi:hypothetical protein